jgi:hypothetical protein
MAAYGSEAYRPASQAASVDRWADDYDERLVRGGQVQLTAAG